MDRSTFGGCDNWVDVRVGGLLGLGEDQVGEHLTHLAWRVVPVGVPMLPMALPSARARPWLDPGTARTTLRVKRGAATPFSPLTPFAFRFGRRLD